MNNSLKIVPRPVDDVTRGIRNKMWVKLEQFIPDSLYKIRKGMAYDRALAIEQFNATIETNRLLRKLAGEDKIPIKDESVVAKVKRIGGDLLDDGKINKSNVKKPSKKDRK